MRQRQLSDYPPGIQVLFRQAGELVERLNRMEMDYRAWKTSADYRTWEAALDEDVVIVEAPVTLRELTGET